MSGSIGCRRVWRAPPERRKTLACAPRRTVASASASPRTNRDDPMPIIKVNDQQFALQPGSTRLGGGGGPVDIRVGDDALGVQAIVDLGADGRAVVRRADTKANVRV